VLTILLGEAERLNIRCTDKVFNHHGQLSVHFVDRLQVDQPTDCSRWQEDQHLPKQKVSTYRV
jgi:hypothetical protein